MKQCLFCDDTELTDEHIYADWLVQHFKKHVPPKRGLYKQTLTIDGEVTHQSHQGTIEEKRKLVCGSCNHGWMSAIENFAKPALLPLIDNGKECPRRMLTIEEQCAIAVWVQLRSFIFDALAEPESKYYTREECLAFANGDILAPLADAYIWIAPFHGVPWCTTRRVANGNPRPRQPSGLVIDSAAHVATGTVHKLAFQLFISKGSHPLALDNVNLKRAGWHDTARRIFPSTTDVDWPPRLHVGDESLQPFQTRLTPDTIMFRRR